MFHGLQLIAGDQEILTLTCHSVVEITMEAARAKKHLHALMSRCSVTTIIIEATRAKKHLQSYTRIHHIILV